jgi:hypothetical protein
MTLRDEIGQLHHEHEDLHRDAEEINRRDRSIKWQVSVQNALGVVLAASVMGTGTLLWHWYKAAGEVRAEITAELFEIRDWQTKHAAFAEYGTKDLKAVVDRLAKVEQVMNGRNLFTTEQGDDHERRIRVLEAVVSRTQDHEQRMRQVENKLSEINGNLQEIIRRLDLVHRGARVP